MNTNLINEIDHDRILTWKSWVDEVEEFICISQNTKTLAKKKKDQM